MDGTLKTVITILLFPTPDDLLLVKVKALNLKEWKCGRTHSLMNSLPFSGRMEVPATLMHWTITAG